MKYEDYYAKIYQKTGISRKKEGGCVDLPMHILLLKYALVLFESESSALTLSPFLLSPRINMLCHFSSTMTKDHFLVIRYGSK